MAGYDIYQKSWPDRHSRQTKLILMLIEKLLFEEIILNFVRELPESEVFHVIILATDQVTKVQ